MADADYVVVGSGINALVAAALLGGRGRRVVVLERGDRLGGCMMTGEATLPGFRHDVMAATFVLFVLSPAYAELDADLARHGLGFAHTDAPTGVLMPDGRSLVLRTDRAANVAAFDALAPGDGARFAADMDGLGANAPFLFALLGGSLWSWGMARTVAREAWRRGPRGLAAFFGEALDTARGWLEQGYGSEPFRALMAPWVLHCGLGPEAAVSGQMARVVAFALEAAGAPVAKGGAGAAPAAFAGLIGERGGECRTGADVESILLEGGEACGVRLADGSQVRAARGVICSVTPTQLYGRLLPPDTVPPGVAASLSRYRYGKGDMQIHYALDAPPRWRTPGLEKVALLHLTPGLDGVSKAANEAERGMIPAVPTVCVGQPSALDPSRCPEGKAVLWLQLPEMPRHVKGDAAGEFDIPADGCWTESLREACADRVEAVLASHIENFADIRLARRAYSPADLEALNVNLVGGDPYGGFCGIDQFFLWRPFKGSVNHATHIPRLHHIGASTHPGPGLGGGSGYLLAKSLA